MADSANIDNALQAILGSDATLLQLCPNGVYVDESPPDMQRFVIIRIVDQTDVAQFGGRAYEDTLYEVEARLLSTTANANANARAAAARIDVLLEDQPLTVSGYTWMTCHRESRTRMIEIDAVDQSLRWYRRGGNYRVQMSL
jgi:hypothetical protein